MNLENMKMTEIRELAKSCGVIPVQHESRESLVTRLAMMTYPDTQKTVVTERQVAASPVFLSQERVIAAVGAIIDKGLGLTFDEDSWFAKYRGAEDSGSLSMPLNVIVNKVTAVARGAFVPRIIRNTGTDMDGAIA